MDGAEQLCCCMQAAGNIFVSSWAGKDVEQDATHGPFNLMLRLLIELSSGIVVPVSEGAAKDFDPDNTPFQINGHVQAFSVQKQTASSTLVQVRVLSSATMATSCGKHWFAEFQQWLDSNMPQKQE
jgi:hypothetical protein